MSHWYEGWGRRRSDKPEGPLDGAYRQIRWVRLYRPGPWRVVVFLAGMGALFISLLSALLVLLVASAPLVNRLLVSGSLGMIAFGFATLTMRIYSTSVYVNDSNLQLFTLRTTLIVPWGAVADVSATHGRIALLGMPFIKVDGDAVVVTTRDGGPVLTPVTSRGLDFFGRPQAYDVAALAVERWWRDAPRD